MDKIFSSFNGNKQFTILVEYEFIFVELLINFLFGLALQTKKQRFVELNTNFIVNCSPSSIFIILTAIILSSLV